MEQTISLAGSWRYLTDEEDLGIAKKYYEKTFPKNSFILPGSTCDNQIGSLTLAAKSYDERHLYTQTSNFDHPMSPYEDYFCAFSAYHNPVRIQDLHDEVAKATGLCYDKAVSKVPAPIITFEAGQYCVYPDVDIIEDYTFSNMRQHLI